MSRTRGRIVFFLSLGAASVALWSIGSLAKGNRDTYHCQANLKQIGLGLKQYERDYDEQTVLHGNWQNALRPYIKSKTLFECPSANGYAFNRYLSGASYSAMEYSQKFPTIPTVFDSVSTQPNAADFGNSYLANGAHSLWRRGRGTNVLFFDGHVKWMQRKPVFQAIKPIPPPIFIPLKRPSRVKPTQAR